MRFSRAILGVAVVAMFTAPGQASQLVMFPKAVELVSPDGRFAVRNAEREGSASDLVGTFHSLWLVEISTRHSRKLCDYMGLASVLWAENSFLAITQYVGKKTSRVLVFSLIDSEEPVTLDKSALVRMVPAELRPALRENDHVFIEADRVENQTLHLRVWGYGQRDARGFAWNCEYTLREGAIDCRQSASH